MEEDSIKDLKVEKHKLVASAREIFASAEKIDNGVLSQEQVNQTNKMFARIKDINNSIKAKKEMAEIDKIDVEAALKNADIPAKNKDKDLILNHLKFGTEKILNSMQADSDQSGGFLTMPQKISNVLLDELEKVVHIRKFATVVRTNNINGIGYITFDDGFDEPDWTGEVTLTKESKDWKLGKRELTSHPLSKLVKISRDLISADGFDVVNFALKKLALKFGHTEEKAFITGNGSLQPLGLLTQSKFGIGSSRWISTGNDATKVTFDNLKAVKQAVHQNFRNKGTWMLHSDVVLQLALIKDLNDQYIWQSAVKDEEYDRLLNRPILESEFMPNTFTTGKAIGLYGDLKQYYIHDYGKQEFQTLKEMFSLENKTGFLARKRTDAMPIEEKAFAIMKLG